MRESSRPLLRATLVGGSSSEATKKRESSFLLAKRATSRSDRRSRGTDFDRRSKQKKEEPAPGTRPLINDTAIDAQSFYYR